MPRTRALLALVGALVAALAATAGTAGIADAAGAAATLLPDSQDVRAGDTITMTGTFCATGQSVTALDVSLAQPYPKAPIMTFPLEPAAAGLTQTATGFTFTYQVPGDRQFVWFTVGCSDGSTGSSHDTRVTVWPPYGELWFIYPYPTPAYGTAGATIDAVVHSIDCVEGSTAQAALRHAGTTIATGSGVFTDHWLSASIAVPSGASAGEDYSLRVTCTGTAGGTITDDHPAVIAAADGSLPGTGAAPGGLLWLAATSTLLGVLLLAASRRQRASTSPLHVV